MGRKKVFANGAERVRAYRLRKKGVSYKIVDGFVIQTHGNESVTKVTGHTLISEINGNRIRAQKIVARLRRRRATKKEDLAFLAEFIA